MLVLSRRDVRELLDPRALRDALQTAFEDLSAGRASAPPRQGAEVPGTGVLATMAGHVAGSLAVKVVSLFPGHPHRALVALFDHRDGTPLAVMDGEEITATRTAVTSWLAAGMLARADARTVAVVGTGVQGHAHARVFALDYDEVRVVGRGDVHEAVRDADVVCLCTTSATPVIEASWIAPGTHVGSVGYAPPGGELPIELARSGRLVVESRVAFDPPPAGCAELQGLDPEAAAELGEHPQRTSPDEITVYKSMGHAVEDLAAAALVYREAISRGAGSTVDL